MKIKTRNKKTKLQNLKEIPSSTHQQLDSLVSRRCEYLLPYLPGNGSRKELDVYARFYSCRQCWASQVQRFVEQQQVSLKWITQGLSNSGRKRSKISLSSNPAIKIQEVSCVPNTPNTLVRCIGALVRQRDSKIQVVWMNMSGNNNLK